MKSKILLKFEREIEDFPIKSSISISGKFLMHYILEDFLGNHSGSLPKIIIRGKT